MIYWDLSRSFLVCFEVRVKYLVSWGAMIACCLKNGRAVACVGPLKGEECLTYSWDLISMLFFQSFHLKSSWYKWRQAKKFMSFDHHHLVTQPMDLRVILVAPNNLSLTTLLVTRTHDLTLIQIVRFEFLPSHLKIDRHPMRHAKPLMTFDYHHLSDPINRLKSNLIARRHIIILLKIC